MKRFVRLSLIFAILAIIISSCLTVEKKVYSFEFTGKNSGKLTIKYVNIMSMPGYFDDEEDSDPVMTDFEDLLDTYLNGTKIENDYPMASNIQKRLFEENGLLCGEVTMEFSNLEAVRLFQLDKKAPIMYSISNSIDSEKYVSSNGTLGNADYMNIVFWKSGAKKLELSTVVDEPSDETVSLVKNYRAWKK